MKQAIAIVWQQARARVQRDCTALRRDEKGVTAVEFALVIGPFLMLLFGIIAVGLFFFTTFSLENAVETAARPIRTGEAQAAGMTKEQFKANVCAQLPVYIDCGGKLRINVQSFNVGQAIAAPQCVDAGGALIPPAGTAYAPGTANQVVLVSACVVWSLAGELPFLKLGTMADGSALIQAATTFKSEPFNAPPPV